MLERAEGAAVRLLHTLAHADVRQELLEVIPAQPTTALVGRPLEHRAVRRDLPRGELGREGAGLDAHAVAEHARRVEDLCFRGVERRRGVLAQGTLATADGSLQLACEAQRDEVVHLVRGDVGEI